MDRNQIAETMKQMTGVALRKESVDRNTGTLDPKKYDRTVALRKESVDRNVKIMSVLNGLKRRSPQGERG